MQQSTSKVGNKSRSVRLIFSLVLISYHSYGIIRPVESFSNVFHTHKTSFRLQSEKENIETKHVQLYNRLPTTQNIPRVDISKLKASMSNTNHDEQILLKEKTEKMKSYASNIRRHRKQQDPHTNHINIDFSVVELDKPKSIERKYNDVSDTSTYPAIKSLLHSIRADTDILATCSTVPDDYFDKNVWYEFRNYFNRAIIQAIRASSDNGDYVMIRKIVESAVEYAAQIARVSNEVIENRYDEDLVLLESRIFGEAITEMGKTSAGHSKLKKIWSIFMSLDDSILATPPSAFELNSIIKALANRGKVKSAINLYREVTGKDGDADCKIKSDIYTASALLNMLAESISTTNISIIRSIDNTKKSSLDSPCWQWNEAVSILKEFEKEMTLNNQVYSLMLKVNEEAMDLCRSSGSFKHPATKNAMSILDRMKKFKVSPDVVTCNAVLSTFNKGKQWKAAIAFLRAMERAQIEEGDGGKEWNLPRPNIYIYSSVISACAKSGEYEEAMKLLDEIRSKTESPDENIELNTWIYNSALAACVPMKKNHDEDEQCQYEAAQDILRRMELDVGLGLNSKPDTITYNTLLLTINSAAKFRGKKSLQDDIQAKNVKEQMVMEVLRTMDEKQIPKDIATYRNAIIACRGEPQSSLRMLTLALKEINEIKIDLSEWGSLDNVKAYLLNSSLNICQESGDMETMAKVFQLFVVNRVTADTQSMLNLVKGLSASGNCEDSMKVLNSMKGDGAANEEIITKYGIDILSLGFDTFNQMIEEKHYSAAIAGCLRDGQLFPALKILNAMKIHGLKPKSDSLQGIIMAYCKLATEDAKMEFRVARKNYGKSKPKGPVFHADHTTSKERASAALAMMTSMDNIPSRLQCAVASACAATGMWVEAREILWSLHIAAIKEKRRDKFVFDVDENEKGSALADLPKLHRSLLKLCARSGNVTAALSYVDAIQDLQRKLDKGIYHIDDTPSGDIALTNKTNILDSWNVTDYSDIQQQKYGGIGMDGEKWKLLIIAASKSAHWRVCVSTLPFIQPYVEATHPNNASKDKGSGASMRTLNREYEKLSRALTAAVLSFEVRGQYAWAIRAIDDWIQWSGRRPAKEAVISTCRILAKRGIGSEVVSLVDKVIQVPDHLRSRRRSSVLTYETSYEMAVYTEAITALYNRGLYDQADELYVNAISKGFLPFSIVEESSTMPEFKIDLHGMNKAIAHSAVRVSLQHFVQSNTIDELERDVIIITGKGNKSERNLRPVLRPEVQRMLTEEFYPPMSTVSIRNNLGALRIPVSDVNSWIKHQEEAKGLRFLAVADVLKTLTSGQKLRRMLKRNIKRFPTEETESK